MCTCSCATGVWRARYLLLNILRPAPDSIGKVLGRFTWVPLLTVNYDTLLEDAAVPPRSPLSHVDRLGHAQEGEFWNGSPDGDVARRSPASYVVHLHGTYHDRNGADHFALTSEEYNSRPAMVAFTRFLQNGIFGMGSKPRQRSLVLVGCGKTVFDLHFMNLWLVLGAQAAHAKKPLPEHYWLIRGSPSNRQKAAVNFIYAITNVVIRLVTYGKEHKDLKVFLARLLSSTGAGDGAAAAAGATAGAGAGAGAGATATTPGGGTGATATATATAGAVHGKAASRKLDFSTLSCGSNWTGTDTYVGVISPNRDVFGVYEVNSELNAAEVDKEVQVR